LLRGGAYIKLLGKLKPFGSFGGILGRTNNPITNVKEKCIMPANLGQAELVYPQNTPITAPTNEQINLFAMSVISNSVFKEAMFGDKYFPNEQLENVFFCMDQDGKLKHAWGIGKKSSQYYEAYANNRLFIRDSNSMLRQVQCDGESYNVSKPFKDLRALPMGYPGVLKHILNFFFGAFAEEFDEYNKLKAIDNKQTRDYCDVARGLEPRSGIAVTDDPRPEPAPEPVKNVVLEDEEPEIPENETLEQFEERLNRYSEYSKSTINLVTQKSFTMENYIDRITNRARMMAARELVDEIEDDPERRTEILTQAKETFDNMIREIKTFAPKTVDPRDVELIQVRKAMGRNDNGEVMGLKLDFIGTTLLENYRSYVAAGRTDAFKQRKFFNPLEHTELINNGQFTKKYCGALGVSKEIQDRMNDQIQREYLASPEYQAEQREMERRKKARLAEEEKKRKTRERLEKGLLEEIDPKDMDLEEFKEFLGAVYGKGGNTNIATVMTKKDSTPEMYYKAVVAMMGSQVARSMVAELSKDPASLEKQKALYTPLMADLLTYVKNTINKETVDRFYASAGSPAEEDQKYMITTAKNLAKNGLNDYLDLTNKQNAEKEKVQQEQPSNQAELTQSEPQKQGGGMQMG
jgi:hypothetical protein